MENEEIGKQLASAKGAAKRHKSVQVSLDILNSRIMKATLQFKQFLTDHQQVIKT